MRWCVAMLCVLWVGLIAGCAKARFVQVDQGYGVVAIPANTNSWPNYYRDQAEALIRQKCPNGYEVVHEEESVTGQVVHTDTRSEVRPPPTLGIGGVDGESGKGKSGDHSSGMFAGVAIPLGNAEEKTKQTTHVSDVTEWRIHYRAK